MRLYVVFNLVGLEKMAFHLCLLADHVVSFRYSCLEVIFGQNWHFDFCFFLHFIGQNHQVLFLVFEDFQQLSSLSFHFQNQQPQVRSMYRANISNFHVLLHCFTRFIEQILFWASPITQLPPTQSLVYSTSWLAKDWLEATCWLQYCRLACPLPFEPLPFVRVPFDLCLAITNLNKDYCRWTDSSSARVANSAQWFARLLECCYSCC